MTLRDDRAVAHINPRCRAREHDECDGKAWSMSADKPIHCTCRCHRVKAVCPVESCREALGSWGPRDGFSAEWWADKAVVEHVGEYHD